MRSDWTKTTLKNAGVVLIDCDHKTPSAQETGFPYVGIPQLVNGRIVLDGVRLISEEDFVKWRKKSKPITNDVILSRRCNPGETAYVPAGLEIALGQNLVLLRADGKFIYPPFLRWLVQGPKWWEQIKKFINVGAIFNSLKCVDIPNFEILLPQFDIQKQISKVLSDLDDKIFSNTQINTTLETMAQALFKSWFVDFDPVKAKMEARSQGGDDATVRQAAMLVISGKTADALAIMKEKDPEAYRSLAETADLFPERLVESELGLIPEGWEVGVFADLCINVESGGTPKRTEESYWGGEIKWLTSGEVRDVIVFNTKEKITVVGLNNSSAKVWPRFSTVVAMYGATAGQVCMLAEEMAANQACCALIPVEYYRSYVFVAARNSIKSLSEKASGSAQQNLNKGLVENHQILKPNKKIAQHFEYFAFDLIANWISNELESFTLAELRDVLLPKLLSGEIDLSTLPLPQEQTS
ncbi:MAG TPA: restriction endonuclease subunit S [Chitinispirillaceae bacterium]|nr:restriction endonuclease subunit S [Chitinispirillaceae bacterium]